MATIAPTEPHPADLIEQAEELEQRAEQEMVVVRGLRAEAAKLRARADRINHGTNVTVTKRVEREDPLLAAAALAAEDLPGAWLSSDLAKALAITDANRALRLCVALRDMGHVEQVDGRWRSVDPEAAHIRDAVIELAEFTREQLAERVGLVPVALTWYLDDLRGRGIIVGADDELMAATGIRTGRRTRLGCGRGGCSRCSSTSPRWLCSTFGASYRPSRSGSWSAPGWDGCAWRAGDAGTRS
jgi:hypothetical protein